MHEYRRHGYLTIPGVPRAAAVRVRTPDILAVADALITVVLADGVQACKATTAGSSADANKATATLPSLPDTVAPAAGNAGRWRERWSAGGQALPVCAHKVCGTLRRARTSLLGASHRQREDESAGRDAKGAEDLH